MSCRKAGPDSSGILSLSNSCLRPPVKEKAGPGQPGHLSSPSLQVPTDGCGLFPRPCEGLSNEEPHRTSQQVCGKVQGGPILEDNEALEGDALPVAT